MNRLPLVAVLALSVPSLTQGDVVFDSVAEYSGSQGQQGWHYGYYDGDVANPFTPDDFELFPEFDGSIWNIQWGPGGYWTRISQTGGHPNGTVVPRTRIAAEHWAVRRYTSDVQGTLRVGGHIAKQDTSGSGNGVIGHIFVDGVEVYSKFLANNDGAGEDFCFHAQVSLGSIIDFAIDPFQANEYNDSTTYFATALSGSTASNFDADCDVDVHDLNALLSQGPIVFGIPVISGINDLYDLTGDGVIDLADRDEWLSQAAAINGFASPYKPADANLDGAVDGTDFNLWNENKFTTSLLWSDGNFNGDAVVDGSDFNTWNGNKFTSSDGVAAVPEPSAAMLSLVGIFLLSKARVRTPSEC